MILLFLGSWRSTLIIAVSIPLSILTSIIVLSFLHETINIMTLGGLALAVGILVDDATVEIENVNRNLDQGKEIERAILDGASQIAVPALVSTLCICIVFLPMFFLSGVARYLFVPLAEAVVFAMLASYGLSRTLVPTLAKYLLKHAAPRAQPQSAGAVPAGLRARVRPPARRLPGHPGRAGARPRGLRAAVPAGLPFRFSALSLAGPGFLPDLGHRPVQAALRAKTGTRIEETARLCDLVEQSIRRQIPHDQLLNILDEIGLPYSSINTIYSNSAPVGTADADIMVSLTEEHRPTEEYVRMLRANLPREFPGTDFYFLPDDIVSQILNFGLPAPIDVQVIGKNVEANRAAGRPHSATRCAAFPGIADLRIQQTFDQPKLHVFTDRTKAAESGYTQNDVAQSLLISLSGSFQTQPTFWLSPQNGVSYNVVTQAPQYDVQSLQALRNLPLTARPRRDAGDSQRRHLHQPRQRHGVGEPLRYPAHHRYLRRGGWTRSGQRRRGGATASSTPIAQNLVRGSEMLVRGQVETMRKSFTGLVGGPALRDSCWCTC